MRFPSPPVVSAMQRLRVMLEYFHPWPNSAGFYLARGRGWYAERRLAMVRHLVARDGGDPDALRIVDAGARELRAEEPAAGVADASFGGYWAWEALMDSPIEAARRVVWPVDALGAPAYHSYLLGAHEHTLARQPQRVRDFLAATARGFLAAAAEPLAALGAYERATPYFPRELLAASLRAIAPSWLHEARWGRMRQPLLQGYAHWLAQHGVLADADAWQEAIDARFLAEPAA